MSRSFLGFGQAAYIGQPFTNAIKLGGIAGVCVPLLFQWLSYGASSSNKNINVLVSLESQSCKALDQIRSIYIDNLGSDNPVYVYFPDTGATLAAKPNSEGWYPAFTNAKRIWVIGEGFLAGDIPQTFIIACNIPMQAAVNTEIDQAAALWRASPVISRGNSIYNSTFGIPALGDQFHSSLQLNLSIGPGATIPLWNTPYPSGFLYLNSLAVNAVGLTGSVQITLVVESTGIAGTLLSPILFAPAASAGGIYPLVNLTGLQVKLDATQTWRLRCPNAPLPSGSAQVITTFTQQP